jgi:hypothetical protein
MNEGFEAGIGFVGSHGDAFEFFELAEEVLDQVAPFVDFGIERQRLGSTRVLRDDDLGAALVEVGDNGVAVAASPHVAGPLLVIAGTEPATKSRPARNSTAVAEAILVLAYGRVCVIRHLERMGALGCRVGSTF